MNLIEDTDQKIANVYIGDVDDCEKHVLKDNEIQTVVNVSAYEPGTAVLMGFRYIQIPLHDSAGVDELAFAQAVDITQKAIERAFFEDEPVLVHCAAGVSRSAAVLATALARYLRSRRLRYHGFDDGLELVKAARPSVNPVPALREVGEELLEVEN